jgi:hypothetical protein
MISRIIFNRPNNTTAYGAYAYVNKTGSSEPFWLPASNNDTAQRVLLKNINIYTSMSSIPSGLTYFRFQLFSEKPNINATDGLGVANLLTSIDSFLGFLDTGTLGVAYGSLSNQKNGFETVYDLATDKPAGYNGNGLWVTVTTIGGFTPVANTKFVIYFGLFGIE